MSIERPTPIWENFLGLLKIELSTTAFLYAVLGLVIPTISGQNTLLFDLAQGDLPNRFVPYSPFFEKIVFFTYLNLGWIIIGFIGAFCIKLQVKVKIILATINVLTFIGSIFYFSLIIFNLSHAFKF